MSNTKPNAGSDAFDDLLDGGTPTTDALRTATEQAHAVREAARESVKRAAAHMRERSEHATRSAHERAHAIGASVRRHAPTVANRIRHELATPIRWRIVGPIMAGSTVLAGGILAGLLAWSAHRFPKLDEPDAPAAPAVVSPAPAPAALDGAPSVVPMPAPAAPPADKPGPSVAATPPIPAPPPASVESSPATPALPPAPTEPTVQNCAAAVPLLNGLFASANRARTPDEIAWAAFGYRCAQSGALTYSNAGYALKSAELKPEKPRLVEAKPPAGEPMRTPARATKAPARDANAHAPVVATIPQAPAPTTAMPVTPTPAPETCVLRGTASTTEGAPMPNAPVEITGLDGSHFRQQVSADAAGRFTVSVPSGARVRAVLRARGYLDDVRETLNCAPIVLTGKKSNPFSSIFDAARRADRSIKGATGGR